MFPALHELPDGRRLLIRPIEPADKGRLAAGLSRLSDETIRRRFLVSKPRFSSSELRYLTEIDGHDHIALVVVLEEDPDVFVAVARCVRLPDEPQTAEWAIVIADELQGMGLGRRLIGMLADEARENGITRFTATMFGENRAAQRLMRTVTQRLDGSWSGGGVRRLAGDLIAA